jgi:hypothetical protein
MIPANELRIGNWIQVLGIYKNSFERAGIIQADAELIRLCADSKVGLLGIELYPELLGKCGFSERLPDSEKVISYRNDSNVILNSYKSNQDEWFLYPVLWDPYAKIKYLHQLQNLYFALTGKELKIDL